MAGDGDDEVKLAEISQVREWLISSGESQAHRESEGGMVIAAVFDLQRRVNLTVPALSSALQARSGLS